MCIRDSYTYCAVKILLPNNPWVIRIYLLLNIVLWAMMFSYRGLGLNKGDTKYWFIYIGAVFMSLMVAKIVAFLVLFGADIVGWIGNLFTTKTNAIDAAANGISRKTFISKVALGIALSLIHI